MTAVLLTWDSSCPSWVEVEHLVPFHQVQGPSDPFDQLASAWVVPSYWVVHLCHIQPLCEVLAVLLPLLVPKATDGMSHMNLLLTRLKAQRRK